MVVFSRVGLATSALEEGRLCMNRVNVTKQVLSAWKVAVAARSVAAKTGPRCRFDVGGWRGERGRNGCVGT